MHSGIAGYYNNTDTRYIVENYGFRATLAALTKE